MRSALLAGLLGVVFLASCSGSDSPPQEPGPESIVGDWGGSLDDCVDGCLGVVTVGFTADGQFTYSYNSGATTFAGTYQRVAERTYLLTEAGGNKGVLVTDGAGAHAGILHTFSGLQVGVVQKGASGPTGTYALSDAYGGWAGAGFIPDDAFAIVTPFTASATIFASLCEVACAGYNWTDSSGFSLSSQFSYVDPTYGNGYESLDQAFWFLTPDRNFIGIIFCTTWPSNPSECRIEGLSRQ